MRFIIHRGAHEIGGSCVEIQTDLTRILIDFGMPLIDQNGEDFDFNDYKDLSKSELIKSRILPEINGVYKGEKLTIDGVLISHPHQDHYGFVNFLHDDLKFYLGEASYRIINTANLFVNRESLFPNHSFIKKNISFQIGDIKITPYWMDHSAFDAYAFLIESEGKSLFYSGDFRGHGRKSNAYNWFLNNAPSNVDYLLVEGTMIGRNNDKEPSENELQSRFEKYFSENKLNLVSVSAQNIDRLVTIYKACKRTCKTLVIDPYIANILSVASRFAKVQHPSDSFENIKVLFSYFLTKKMINEKHEELIYPFKSYKITRNEIDLNPGKYVMCVRPSLKSELDKMTNIDVGNHIFSLWSGYLSQSYTRDFIDYLTKRGFTQDIIHSSGHADIPTLKEFVSAIQPKTIVPIHTFSAAKYKDIFDFPVKEVMDGEAVDF